MRVFILFLYLLSPQGSVTFAQTEGEYEIDYEEEVEGDLEPTPTPAPSKKGKKNEKGVGLNTSAVQGSRAKNRFTPMIKSETKSVYKKDGRRLDVDTD